MPEAITSDTRLASEIISMLQLYKQLSLTDLLRAFAERRMPPRMLEEVVWRLIQLDAIVVALPPGDRPETSTERPERPPQ